MILSEEKLNKLDTSLRERVENYLYGESDLSHSDFVEAILSLQEKEEVEE